MLGWTEIVCNHITLRLPEAVSAGEKQFLINPFGPLYSEGAATSWTTRRTPGGLAPGRTLDVLDGASGWNTAGPSGQIAAVGATARAIHCPTQVAGALWVGAAVIELSSYN